VLRQPVWTKRLGAVALGIGLGVLACSCSSAGSSSTNRAVSAVGAENQYANVIAQIGGRYVDATAIMSNPNTDPHSFEASPAVARAVSSAQLIVQNGVLYDTFMNTIEAASPNPGRRVIEVQRLLKIPENTANPHLWYDPTTMPVLAKAIEADLCGLRRTHCSYFRTNLARFESSLQPWREAIARFKKAYPHTPVATTEPVADYMLEAAGTDNLTPFGLQADIMNGVDPAPQDISLQDNLFDQHKVKVFLYNEQVTDSITESFLSRAKADGIPVVGVYETMPTPGYDYQSWMLAEVRALYRAVADKASTEHL